MNKYKTDLLEKIDNLDEKTKSLFFEIILKKDNHNKVILKKDDLEELGFSDENELQESIDKLINTRITKYDEKGFVKLNLIDFAEIKDDVIIVKVDKIIIELFSDIFF